jgi:hypothetical protein
MTRGRQNNALQRVAVGRDGVGAAEAPALWQYPTGEDTTDDCIISSPAE